MKCLCRCSLLVQELQHAALTSTGSAVLIIDHRCALIRIASIDSCILYQEYKHVLAADNIRSIQSSITMQSATLLSSRQYQTPEASTNFCWSYPILWLHFCHLVMAIALTQAQVQVKISQTSRSGRHVMYRSLWVMSHVSTITSMYTIADVHLFVSNSEKKKNYREYCYTPL